MKKTLLLILALTFLSIFNAISQNEDQLKFVSNSFTEKSGNFGNLTAMYGTNWPMDINGEAYTALIRVFINNMSTKDAKDLDFIIIGGSAISKKDLSNLDSKNEIDLFVTATNGINLEAHHPIYGKSNRYAINQKLKPKGVYEITLMNDKTLTINISSTPKGASVYLDNNYIGVTDVQPQGITYGKHKITLSLNGSTVKNEDIDVSEGNINFVYDLRQKKDVLIKTDPSNANLYLVVDSDKKLIGKSPQHIELPYGPCSIIATLDNDNKLSDTANIMVSDMLSEWTLHPVIKKDIEIFAKYAGQRVNSRLFIDNKSYGEFIGDRSYTAEQPYYLLHLPYGTYDIRVSYSSNDKKKKIKVNKHSPSSYEIKIPTRNRIVWPWEREYDVAPIGFSIGYVQKQWVSTGNGEKFEENAAWGDEGGRLHGFQTGLHFQPCFSWGLGLYTGLFYECYISMRNTDDLDEGSTVYADFFQEHSIYIPLHLYYRLPFAEKVALSVHGGLGFDCGIYSEFSFTQYDNIEPITNYYDEEGYPKRINFSSEIAVGLRIKGIQINAFYSKGITDHKFYISSGNYKTVQNKLGLSMSWVFGSN
jgi:hypothetical protein